MTPETPKQPASPPPGRWSKPPRRYSGALFFGLLLVTLGVVLLLGSLGVIDWDIWDSVLRLWPVLIIAGGLDGLFNRQGVVGPVFWTGIGILFLLSTLGYLSASVWELALTLWPLIFVVIGVEILVGYRLSWLSIIAAVVVVAMLAGVVGYIGVDTLTGQAITGDSISQTLDGATQASVLVRPAVGNVEIGSLSTAQADLLTKGIVHPRKGETVMDEYTVTDGRGRYTIFSQGMSVVVINDLPDIGWDLDFTQAIPLDFTVDFDIGNLKVDFTDSNLSHFDVSMAIGNQRVYLPEKGKLSGKVSGQIGMTTIVVSRGVGVRIEYSQGLGNINVPGDFTKQGRVYLSPGYASADVQIDLEVSQSLGTISVVYQ